MESSGVPCPGAPTLIGGTTVLAPLPRLYRLLVLASVLTVCIGAGVWLARSYDLPFGGVLVGTSAGLLIAFAVLHDFRGRTRPTRVPRRR